MLSVTLNRGKIAELQHYVAEVYLRDDIPWVVGYSGGKDSTAALQLVWYALSGLSPADRRRKPVHVISTDTLVEQPIVAQWVSQSLHNMASAASEQSLPIQVHRLTPRPHDTFWVNLIGRGYPAPRPLFRWCTSRLKIDPANRFIKQVVEASGRTILVLGTRKAESSARGRLMKEYQRKREDMYLSPNGRLPNSTVFTPIEDWRNEDVWFYLMQEKNPWDQPNTRLLTMYRGASADNECPLVIDTQTPSCGSSRFGCWVCTLVTRDKSMQAMIQNDEEKAWMTPLLELRDEIAAMDQEGKIRDRDRRDFRRANGSLTVHQSTGELVPGPYTRVWREYLLRRLLETEDEVRSRAPQSMRDIRLVSDEELAQIRDIWLLEKHEFLDSLPRIWMEVRGQPYTDEAAAPRIFGPKEWALLENVCGDDPLMLELQASLLSIAERLSGPHARRHRIKEFEKQLERCSYGNEENALNIATREQAIRGPRQLHIWQGAQTDATH